MSTRKAAKTAQSKVAAAAPLPSKKTLIAAPASPQSKKKLKPAGPSNPSPTKPAAAISVVNDAPFNDWKNKHNNQYTYSVLVIGDRMLLAIRFTQGIMPIPPTQDLFLKIRFTILNDLGIPTGDGSYAAAKRAGIGFYFWKDKAKWPTEAGRFDQSILHHPDTEYLSLKGKNAGNMMPRVPGTIAHDPAHPHWHLRGPVDELVNLQAAIAATYTDIRLPFQGGLQDSTPICHFFSDEELMGFFMQTMVAQPHPDKDEGGCFDPDIQEDWELYLDYLADPDSGLISDGTLYEPGVDLKTRLSWAVKDRTIFGI
jgi:hypothetical protein